MHNKRPLIKQSSPAKMPGYSPPHSPETKLLKPSPLSPAGSLVDNADNIDKTKHGRASFRESESKIVTLTSRSDENDSGLSRHGSKVKRTLQCWKSKMMLKAGSNTRWLSRLEKAVSTNQCADVTRLLANNSGDVSVGRFRDGDTLLHAAVKQGCVKCCESLLSYQIHGPIAGVQNTQLDTVQNSVVNNVLRSKEIKQSTCLVDVTNVHPTTLVNIANAQPLTQPSPLGDIPNAQGVTPLMLACERNHLDLCELLVKYSADIEARSVLGETALHISTRTGHYYQYECCSYLLDCGADINAQTNTGVTPLHSLVHKPAPNDDSLRMLVMFMKRGAKTDVKASCRRVYQGRPVTAFQLALLINNIQAVVTFTEAGWEIPAMSLSEWPSLKLFSKTINGYICKQISTVSPLKVCCRNVINRTLNSVNMDGSIEQLGLPAILGSYLRYDNLYEVCYKTVQELLHTEDSLLQTGDLRQEYNSL